jgi:hypothetical protein
MVYFDRELGIESLVFRSSLEIDLATVTVVLNRAGNVSCSLNSKNTCVSMEDQSTACVHVKYHAVSTCVLVKGVHIFYFVFCWQGITVYNTNVTITPHYPSPPPALSPRGIVGIVSVVLLILIGLPVGIGVLCWWIRRRRQYGIIKNTVWDSLFLLQSWMLAVCAVLYPIRNHSYMYYDHLLFVFILYTVFCSSVLYCSFLWEDLFLMTCVMNQVLDKSWSIVPNLVMGIHNRVCVSKVFR